MRQWYCEAQGKRYGPMAEDVLRSWAKQGKIKAGDHVWTEGMAKWVPASQVKGLLPETPQVPAAVESPASVETALVPSSPVTPARKPGKLQAVAIMVLIAGILNCLWGATLIAIFFWTCVIFLIAPFWIVLGILEIIYATKLLPDPIKASKPAKYIAIMEIVTIIGLDVISAVVGILSLVFYSDPEVRACFPAAGAEA